MAKSSVRTTFIMFAIKANPNYKMPQPFKSRLPDWETNPAYYFHDIGLKSRPNIARAVGVCIAAAANCELQIFRLYLSLMGEKANVALAMLETIRGRDARVKVTKKIARVVILDDVTLDVFNAAISMALSTLSQRDKLAHWTWGYTDSLPEDGLACDPRELLEDDSLLLTAYANDEPRPNVGDVCNHIVVYTEKELDQLAAELLQADNMIDLFRRYFHEHDATTKETILQLIQSNPFAKDRIEKQTSKREAQRTQKGST